MKTPITYYGGKQRLAKTIVKCISAHDVYIEPFFGGGAVFFEKEKSITEVINDLNDDVVNFYRVCKTDFGILRLLIQSTPHSRKVHREAQYVLKNAEHFSTIKRAWACWVQTNMSFASKIYGGFGYEKKGNRTVIKTFKKRSNFTRELLDRLELTQIECNDALKVITTRDCKQAFIYADPPYFNSDMGHYGGYTERDFEGLLTTLSKVEGKFILSSYPSDLLSRFTKKNGWNVKSLRQIVSASNANKNVREKQKIEVLTANYPLPDLG